MPSVLFFLLFLTKYSLFFPLKSPFDCKDFSDLLHKMGNMMDIFVLRTMHKRYATEHEEWVFNIQQVL